MGKLDMSKMNAKRDEVAERLTGGGEFNFYEIKDGSQVIRVLPPKGNKDTFWKEADLHFNVGGNGVVPCLKQFGKKCPVCEEVAKLKKSKSKEDQTQANKMRASHRVYMNILERGNSEKVDIPQIMQCGSTVLKSILDVICDPEYGDITDFAEGFDVTLTKTGKKLDTKYAIVPKRNPSQATEKLTAEELDAALPELDALVVEKTKEEVLSIMDGSDEDDTAIDDDDKDKSSSNSKDDSDEDEIERRIREEIAKSKK